MPPPNPRRSSARFTTRGRRFPPEPLTDAEVRALLAACDWPGPTACRARALIALMYRSGLRVGEALSLRPVDVDGPAGAVRVLRAKGGRSRTVGLDPGGLALVAAWAARRAALPRVGPGAPLLCTASGGPLCQAYVRQLLKRLGAKAGLAKRVHAHGLRHTHAAQLRREGVDIGIISKQLGHADIATTARYLDHIAPAAVIRAIAARSWRAELDNG